MKFCVARVNSRMRAGLVALQLSGASKFTSLAPGRDSVAPRMIQPGELGLNN